MPSAKIVDVGFAIQTNLESGLGGTVPKYIGWGTGTTPVAHTDTDLVTPANEARVSGTVSRQTTNATNDTLRVTGTLVSLSAQTISELGIFDGAGSGTPPSGANMKARAQFTGYVLAIGDSIAVTANDVKTSGT